MSSLWMDWRTRAALGACSLFVACGSDTSSTNADGTGGFGAVPVTANAAGTGGSGAGANPLFSPRGGTGNAATGGSGNVATGGTGNVGNGGTGNVATAGSSSTGGLGGSSGSDADGGLPDGSDGDGSLGQAGGDAGGDDASSGQGGLGGASGSGGSAGSSGSGGVAGLGGSGGVAGSGGSGGAAPGCAGRPGALQGYSSQSVTVGLTTRTFIYYAPPSLDPTQPAPLVIVPHGYTMSGQIMYDITGYKDVADREGFVAVFPDGTAGNPWNCGANICGAGATVNGTGDDQAFMDALIEFVDQDQCLDRDHVFMSGFSMGGYFTNESGCLRSDLAGIGPHSGGSHDLTSCPGSIKPVIIFHFENDGLISYTCGTEARDRWAARNGCSLTNPEIRAVQSGNCEYYQGCDPKGQVALCHFTGGVGPIIAGHGWAGGVAGLYSVPDAANAAELGWAFFKEFGW